MSDYKVYVVSKNGRPLMPTRRFGKVRRLLKSRRARVIRLKPFTIQLLYETPEYTQRLTLAVDPGGKNIGSIVRDENYEVLEAGHLETRSVEIPEMMNERRMYRRLRRGHRRHKRQRRARVKGTCFDTRHYQIPGTQEGQTCRLIKPKLCRFNNRRRSSGWLTPTARHLLDSLINYVKSTMKRVPLARVCVEYAKFDQQKLDNPQIQGTGYQNGRQKGYANVQEYVLCRDRHTCQLNPKHHGQLHVHHVIWKRDGGADTPENLLTLCSKCHERVHKSPKLDAKVKKMFAGMPKRKVHTTLLNIVMPYFMQWLTANFQEVEITYGYETKEKRRELNWPKDHHIDAYLISLPQAQDAKAINWEEVPVYEYRQFRRHHRQVIHATRDRNYKIDNKIVAKNRHKRTGQKHDSLAELVAREGKQIMAQLQVLPGKKAKRSKFKKFGKGDLVEYQNKVYVVKGYGEKGKRVGLIGPVVFAQDTSFEPLPGKNGYVSGKDCRLLERNRGLVCL